MIEDDFRMGTAPEGVGSGCQVNQTKRRRPDRGAKKKDRQALTLPINYALALGGQHASLHAWRHDTDGARPVGQRPRRNAVGQAGVGLN